MKNFPNFNQLPDWNGFAAINSDQSIDQACAIAQELSTSPEIDLNSQFACDAFMELTGCEEAISEIIDGKLPYLEFNQINRPAPDGAVDLFDFKVMPMDEFNPQNGAVLLIRHSYNQS